MAPPSSPIPIFIGTVRILLVPLTRAISVPCHASAGSSPMNGDADEAPSCPPGPCGRRRLGRDARRRPALGLRLRQLGLLLERAAPRLLPEPDPRDASGRRQGGLPP